MKIKPTYVTFEQAKWLKEKGFRLYGCKIYHTETELRDFPNIPKFYPRAKNQEETYESVDIYFAPEQWQVVEWLRVKHGILVFVEPANGEEDKCLFAWYICDDEQNTLNSDSDFTADISKHFKTPQEAYSAAFDYVLNNQI